jgi:hypothetical protein
MLPIFQNNSTQRDMASRSYQFGISSKDCLIGINDENVRLIVIENECVVVGL